MLLKECVKTQGLYTIIDFSEYIARESSKSFTQSQLTGAIAQLVDLGEIIRVERGLYKGKCFVEKCIKENVKENNTLFNRESILCLDKVEKILTEFVDSQKVMQLNEREIGILLEMREIKEKMKSMREKCEN